MQTFFFFFFDQLIKQKTRNLGKAHLLGTSKVTLQISVRMKSAMIGSKETRRRNEGDLRR